MKFPATGRTIVYSEEESMLVQKYLFERGYTWVVSCDREFKNLDMKYLFWWESKRNITSSNDRSFFDTLIGSEHVLIDFFKNNPTTDNYQIY